ncbi:hypothetical protein C474_01821 [Halogeometricum pallidum JCM 14848]|uniref:Uncharacterized protein n=1 Tax=Halogeometricum pallidum JCM 14848 TaxID=1227487 RepID=M0DJQ8_HALPD|nr:hypothetical protein C474_01821 [Halogeometricum pallidum JCM 14848]
MLALLLVTATFPAAASAATTVGVAVDQDDATGEAVVLVTDNGTAVENATVNVTGELAYAGAGTYRTDANGTVTLPEPAETQNVTVVAADGDATGETTVRLVGAEFSVDVTQADDGAVTVDVSRAGAAVENATVEVTVENGSYAAAGNYTTDGNGTVELAAPAENVTATVTASEADDAATETVTLLALSAPLDLTVEQAAGVEIDVSRGGEAVENATVNVTSDGNYSGTGTFETGADGTVSLAAPTENVSITVSATADGDTVSETVELTTEFVGEQRNFGQAVRAFLDALRTAGFNGPPGRIISDFATANNPGNADDAPGRSDASDQSDAPGRSDARGQAKKDAADDKRGPPEHAKSGQDGDDSDASKDDRVENDADEEDSEDADADDGDDESEDDEKRPSSDRGNGNGNGRNK